MPLPDDPKGPDFIAEIIRLNRVMGTAERDLRCVYQQAAEAGHDRDALRYAMKLRDRDEEFFQNIAVYLDMYYTMEKEKENDPA